MDISYASRKAPRRWVHLFVAVALSCTACVSVGFRPPEPLEVRSDSTTVLIGSFDFTESEILAHLYKGVLEEAGFEATVLERVATREIMEPALEQEHLDVVAEYQGTLLEFLEPGAASSNPRVTHTRLAAELEGRGLAALDYAPAQNQNVFAVTSVTSGQHALQQLSDLRPVAGDFTFGGPPECPSRPLCLGGLEETYDIEFADFQPLDVGGPLTVAALRGGEIDVGLLFSTDPSIGNEDFVVLQDDRGLQPSENVVPVVRQEILDEHGPRFADALNELSSLITLDALRSLNASAADTDAEPAQIAREWLEAEGLI